ncbi:NAD-dependent epimerase/dehydratase family protein [Amycolatopsis pithecellobii]|uniref:NAD-dependent epimerase/dehydratase family protein n=1 Tax=Amycolatopsis pithecellobii TaxID=664692 RepID=A0A6N7YNZ7_9PSEU|nr:NAD(P)-dependent oxidoreductase [Amycolatopsis pithecellobii]MTD53732.1 NAD-dependent epimerase/dehydratase family protein [Amycolatopsis pithecellobii]
MSLEPSSPAKPGHALITGTGLLGAHVGRWLLDDGWEVTLLDRAPDHSYLQQILGRSYLDRGATVLTGDLLDPHLTSKTLKGVQPDVVIHTAALIALEAQRNLGLTLDVNVVAPARLATWAAENGAHRFVATSTWGVYDQAYQQPLTEDSPVGPVPQSHYAASKVAMEYTLHSLATTGALSVVVARPSTLYGYAPADAGGPGTAVIERLVRAALRGEPVTVSNAAVTGGELVYAVDAAKVLASAASSTLPDPFTIVLASSGELTDAYELADAIRTHVPSAQVDVDRSPATGPRPPRYAFATDASKTRILLGLDPPSLLKDGIGRYIEAMRGYEAQEEHTR